MIKMSPSQASPACRMHAPRRALQQWNQASAAGSVGGMNHYANRAGYSPLDATTPVAAPRREGSSVGRGLQPRFAKPLTISTRTPDRRPQVGT